jgi:ornithine carbamoyltransferase
MKRDFLKLADLSHREHRDLLDRARELKAYRRERELVETLKGRTLGLVFEKPSTRTRVSFEAAMCQLGGTALSLPMADSQIKRGETLEDTARVLSRYVDGLVFRTHGEDRLAAFAGASSVPVINGLSELAHPVQLLADLMTVQERLGSLEGRRVAFIGDGASNMALSWIEAAGLFEFQLTIGAPKGYQPTSPGAKVTDDPRTAVIDAEVVVTDVWLSMGQEDEAAKRRAAFAGFQVDEALLRRASPKAIVLHCLPAHRGDEISAGVIDGPQSAVFDEAENRLHTQKALLELLLG